MDKADVRWIYIHFIHTAYEVVLRFETSLTILDKFKHKADNIYYSDPDRANAYLGGGAVPKNEQSIAYLLRNDVLTNLEGKARSVASTMFSIP